VDGFIVLTIDGHLAEGFNTNVWLIKEGKLFTLSENTLAGITSECIYDLAREINIEATGAFLIDAYWKMHVNPKYAIQVY